MNRVIAAIDRMEKQLAERVATGLTTQPKLDETSKKLDLPWDEYVRFQELKSLASIEGKLTLDEAQTIYEYLGESGPDQFNAQPVHVKVILTKIFAELLGAKIKGMQPA
jgi:hypothetical protein